MDVNGSRNTVLIQFFTALIKNALKVFIHWIWFVLRIIIIINNHLFI